LARHADAVFDLRVLAVVSRVREWSLRRVVPLIREVDEGQAMAFWLGGETLLPRGDALHHRLGLGDSIRAHRRQGADLQHIVVLRQPHWNDRDGLYGLAQRSQFRYAAVQLVAVVDLGAEHELRVALNAHRAQPLNLLDNLA